ncbi:MAG TPA: aldo/keto reductase [Gemmatimonadota bacterium]|nr:aldo/keto reductase [Gemmatimonadota bacterium]
MDTVSAAAAGTHDLGGGLVVHRLGFGAMRVTGEDVWGPPDDWDRSIRVLRRAVELGVNFLDTADSYGPGVSEELIAEALHPYPEGVVVATKGGLTRPSPGEWPRDGRPEHLREALDGSLRRLRVDRIDLYQLHAPDPDVPYEESVGALKDFQDAGKVLRVGVSNVDLDELEIARGIVEVASVQNRFNLKDRSSEDVLDRCQELGIAFIPWFPLAAGKLAKGSGLLRRKPEPLARIAKRLEATPAQVALAWLLARSPVMLPIPGTSSLDHLEENVRAASIELSAEEVEELAEVGE